MGDFGKYMVILKKTQSGVGKQKPPPDFLLQLDTETYKMKVRKSFPEGGKEGHERLSF